MEQLFQMKLIRKRLRKASSYNEKIYGTIPDKIDLEKIKKNINLILKRNMEQLFQMKFIWKRLRKTSTLY